ncbi:MAG: methionyl-tRNA formyltransferase [Sporolactobacillus sp.]
MKIAFMGTPDFSVPILEKLIEQPDVDVVCVVTQPDRPRGRRHVLTAPPVKLLAARCGIPVLQPERVRQPEAVAAMLAYAPDLLVTAAYGQILPQSLLLGPPLGCVNVHASLLPAYRGAAPIQRAIIDGQSETGITIMYMVKQLDAGDILAQSRVKITAEDNFGTLHDKLSAAGATLLMQTLPFIASGSVRATPQDNARVTYAAMIQREDEVIDWTKPAQRICWQIRGLSPCPGAYSLLDGKPFKIYAADAGEERTSEQPGTVVAVTGGGFCIAAGEGSVLVVHDCQPFGGRRMAVADYLRGSGRKLSVGAQFGGAE